MSCFWVIKMSILTDNSKMILQKYNLYLILDVVYIILVSIIG